MRTVRTCPATSRSCSLGHVVARDTSAAAADDVVREGSVVLVDEARRAGDSVLLARRSPDDQQRTVGGDTGSLRLSKFHAPEIVFGPNSLAEAAHAAVRLGARRPFVVTDPGLTEAGWPSELLDQLREAGLSPVVWTDVTPNPKDHEIEAGHERYVEAGCDVVLGIGGGSVIDAAKGIALLAANGGRILDYEG
ncbi:iron-containing alcohol dehydrogenase, partial [Pseudonocardia sp. 73-21]|uniref:iron-containing alcohol dehydrogenase n=1 Tax=Pseudonocardia sp. 73-21 TaxID=1895809 RepID=UPI0026128126